MSFSIAVSPLLSMQTSFPTIINVGATPNVYIKSHHDYNSFGYLDNLSHQLVLEHTNGANYIIVEFVRFDLGESLSCTGQGAQDVLRIYKNEEVNPIFECGDTYTVPSPLVIDISSGTSIRFTFNSNDENGYRGFLLKYSGMVYITVNYHSQSLNIALNISLNIITRNLNHN